MTPKKKKPAPKQKTGLLDRVLSSVIFRGLGLFFLLVWIFILGVLVGRGDVSFDIVKKKWAEVKAGMFDSELPDLETIKESDPDPKFAFYEELASKKEAAHKKSLSIEKESLKKNQTALKKQSSPKKNREKASVNSRPTQKVSEYVLQVGSFENKGKALAMVKKLNHGHYPAYFSMADIDGKRYYRVLCGPFHTEKKADALKKNLAEREGLSGFVTRANP